ncbi:GreA/GreB family elongation factor [Candidatus Uhrbacteria bacterium]|nr:GreA/GreB family elongation factor [Candidatus Uhrbacteria bacterium]
MVLLYSVEERILMQVPKRRSEQSVKRDSGPVMITADGLARLEKELTQLQTQVPDMIAEIERTKLFGDFSENAAYQDAKSSLRRTYSRIDSLKDRIKRAVIIEKSSDNCTVQLGSTVVLEISGKLVTFEILGHQEADPSQGKISDRSPLGQALMNCSAGEKVTIKTKSGEVEYKILEIK